MLYDFPFTGRQAAKALSTLCKQVAVLFTVIGMCRGYSDAREQVFIVERFFKEVYRTGLDGLHGHLHIPVSCNEDNRESNVTLGKFSLQFQAGYSAHTLIQQHDAQHYTVCLFQKSLGRGECPYAVPGAFKKYSKRVGYRRIIIHQKNILVYSHGVNLAQACPDQ
jgi:hypothetical protein